MHETWRVEERGSLICKLGYGTAHQKSDMHNLSEFLQKNENKNAFLSGLIILRLTNVICLRS